MSRTTVILTGSSGAIGEATVTELKQHGYRVVGIDRRPPRDSVAPDEFVETDLRDAAAIEALPLQTEPLWGLIHAAGVYPIRRLADYSLELWREVHAVNVEAGLHLARRFRTSIMAGGRIVMVASGAAHTGSRDPGYAASKAALLGLVRSLAIELAGDDVRVNAVSPGLIDSEMSAAMDPARRSEHLARTLLGRAGYPQEVAVGIRFMLDPNNTYMTGANLDMNGGLYLR